MREEKKIEVAAQKNAPKKKQEEEKQAKEKEETGSDKRKRTETSIKSQPDAKKAAFSEEGLKHCAAADKKEKEDRYKL